MKKKFFSKLLMVALVATVGAFSSCKDYDDDIADVRNSLTQKATELQKDYNDKIAAVNTTLEKLQTSYDNLEAAYKKADEALKAQLETTIGDKLAEAKAYTDAAKGEALTAAQAAEAAAKTYAEQQAAAAQAAAIAAAKEQVAAAQKELSDKLAAANELIASQGKSIENLLKADQTLEAAIATAQARANEAYALADKANTLAETNKANLEKAASDIAALQTSLSALESKAADKADVAKLQSDLAALQKTVNENVVNLADYKENITKLTSDLAALKDDLAKQVSILGESIAAVKATAEGNVAKIESINTQLAKLQEANTQAHEQIIASVNSLAQTVEANKGEAATALAKAVEGIEAKLAATNKLIETNDAAIRALVDTKASELKALIDGNTAAIVKNAQDIQKNADAQKAENTLMNNAIAKNAQDIVAQGKDITKLDDAVKALKTALGDDTAATLKAYAESVAQSEALQALLDAKGYADAQDAAQNLTIMEAIKQQAAQDKAAWESAISLAIENLVTTYKLASLDEYIKQTAAAAQTAAETNAAAKAQEIANDALQKAKAYTDVLAQTLKDNYTTTTDMQTAIENAKKAAISQAYLDVLNTLLRDYDAWYSMNNENKMNLELTPTIIELTKAAVEKYGLTLSNAQELVDKTIEAGLTKPEGTGTYDKDGNEIMTEPGVIMAEILAAADALQQEFTSKFNDIDLRLQPIEEFLGATLGEGEAFKASVNAIIATSATASDVEALKKQLAGTEASGLLTKIDDAAAQAAQNAADVQKVMTTIQNINGMFTSLFAGAEATSNVDEKALKTFEENIQALVERINGIKEITDNLDQKVMESVNKNLGAEIQSMITSVNLFANQHMANNDDPDALGFDHDLVFTYVIEEDNVFPRADIEGAAGIDFTQQMYVDGKVEFKKGTLRTYGDKILVRVSPVNATFTKEQVALINSKKEDIVGKGIVEVTNVERYTGPEATNGYITRSAEEKETGLWVISFKLKDNEGQADAFDNFKKAAYVDGDKQILYAVGIKNTNFSGNKEEVEDDGIDRYVVSEYDLGLGAEPADHSWDYLVNGEIVAKIHNRYIQNENKPNEGEILWTAIEKDFPDSYFDELTYKFDYPENPCPNGPYDGGGQRIVDGKIQFTYPGYTYAQFVTEGENLNVTNRHKNTDQKKGGYITNGIDNRHDYPIKVVNFEKDEDGEEWANITIKFPTPNCAGNNTDIKAFYVTLDQNFARESTTSEVSAWTQYIYDGVGFQSVNGFDTETGEYRLDNTRNDEQAGIVEGKRKATLFVKEVNDDEPIEGTIRVKNARGAKGDIIGFRVFAVNLDGTLYDPDGRAFYVKLGDKGEEHELSFDVEAKQVEGDAAKQNEDIAKYNEDNKNKFFNVKQTELNKGGKYEIEWNWDTEAVNPFVENAGFPVTPDDVNTPYDQFFDFTFTAEGKEVALNSESWNEWDKIAVGSVAAPYKDIQNVKVTLKAANRLIDNATYNLVLTVKLRDAEGALSTVNTIKVKVTKVMPTSLPDAFKIRGSVEENDIVYNDNVYLKPVKKYADEPWSITSWYDKDAEDNGVSKIDNDKEIAWAADILPYSLEEKFAGIVLDPTVGQEVYDENYKFEFEGCGDYDTADKTKSAFSTFDKWDLSFTGLDTDGSSAAKGPHYGIPYVHNSVIGKTVKVKAGYTYKGISYDPEKKIAKGSDYIVEPYYFNSLGDKVEADKAAYTVKFLCGLEGAFTVGLAQTGEDQNANPTYDIADPTVKVFKADGTTEDTENDGSDEKPVPYGNNFEVNPGMVGQPVVGWNSKLPVYVAETTAATYHRTAFNQIGNQTLSEDKTFATFSIDDLVADANGLVKGKKSQFAALVKTAGPDARKPSALSIKGGEYSYNNKKVTITEKEIKEFFEVTTNAETGVMSFKFLDNPQGDNPGKFDWIRITLSSEHTSYKLLHQWGHEEAADDFFPNDITIQIGKPYSAENIQARQAR